MILNFTKKGNKKGEHDFTSNFDVRVTPNYGLPKLQMRSYEVFDYFFLISIFYMFRIIHLQTLFTTDTRSTSHNITSFELITSHCF